MRPRLFVVMLAAFTLVIVLGIGGMFGFFGLAVSGFWLPPDPGPEPVRPAVVTVPGFPEAFESDQAWIDEWRAWRENQIEQGVPGRLSQRFTETRNRVVYGVLSGALGLAAILLLLAAFFSRRISQPLARMTAAAQALAAGDRRARAVRSSVREIDNLALAFNTMADSLDRADQQRRQLTADVAHELRTPLSIIKGRLEGIQDGVYTPSPDQITGLLEETDLLERLIDDLRLLALADAGQLPLYVEPCDPAGLLHDAARSFAQPARERGVALEVSAGDVPAEIVADPQRIAQVLGNLLSNALRHTPPGGRVILHVEGDRQTAGGIDSGLSGPASTATRGSTLPAPPLVAGASVLFSIHDSGAGIAPEDLPFIFERFYRADRSRARSSGGAGLGLAIARRIVEAHGGTIWAQSTLGQGATISFCLPYHASTR